LTLTNLSDGQLIEYSAATRKGRRRVALLLATGAAVIGGVSVATVVPASAVTDYGISMTQACRYTWGGPQYWADFNNPFNPYSWVCRQNSYTVGFPPSVTVTTVGGVDVQKYCTITYPGSRAVIVSWNAYGWRCRR
jgi:hypothetical protein